MLTAVVRPIADAGELAAALALRAEVFCEEQGVTLAAERDGRDDDALHLVAITPGGMVEGTCRLLFEPPGTARLGRLCVRRGARGRGLAAELLAEAERRARAAGIGRVTLHAQTSALELYRRAGYHAEGLPFEEEGIEHLRMARELH